MPTPFYSSTETYIHLDLPNATELAVGPDFWQTIDQRTELSRGYLMMVGPMDANMDVLGAAPRGRRDRLPAVRLGRLRARPSRRRSDRRAARPLVLASSPATRGTGRSSTRRATCCS